jgi:GNAT superfamily N-acetyltransferase
VIDPYVRDAGEHDRADLTELERVARAALVDQRGGARWLEEHAPHGPDWSAVDGRADASRGAAVLVAVLDEVPVGYLVQVADGDVVRIIDVYVRPEARELGFGDELLATGLARAREAGARWFEGAALPGDRDTKNLYERAGITARLITVSTRLA